MRGIMDEGERARWRVYLSSAAVKQKRRMSLKLQMQLDVLEKEIEVAGPVRKNWSHYRPLVKRAGIPTGSHHCHIKSGKPTYVVCWYVVDVKQKIVEIFYVGTHENAPY